MGLKWLLVLVLVVAGMTVPASAEDGLPVQQKTALLNDELKSLSRAVSQGIPEGKIVGRELELTLELRFCSDRHLSFEDTKVVVGKTTSYGFVKWQFSPEQVKAVVGKRGVP